MTRLDDLKTERAKLKAQIELLLEMLEDERRRIGRAPGDATSLKPVIFGLTTKQQATLQMLMNGRTNGEIAHRLGTDVSTAKVHVRGVFRNFDVRTRKEVIRKAAAAWAAIDPAEYRNVTGIRKDWDTTFKPTDTETIAIRNSFKKMKDSL